MVQVETLGDAFAHGVGVTMYCAEGPTGMKRRRGCIFSARLDMMSLVATRGRGFPMARLPERLRCPRCGSRRIRVLYSFPEIDETKRAAGLIS